jgi:hypothetical protein
MQYGQYKQDQQKVGRKHTWLAWWQWWCPRHKAREVRKPLTPGHRHTRGREALINPRLVGWNGPDLTGPDVEAHVGAALHALLVYGRQLRVR